MKSRILRLLLPAILVAAGAGGVVWTWALAQHVEQLEGTGRQTATRIDRLDVLLDELTQNELVYVASGEIDSDRLQSTSKLLRQIVADSSWLLGGLVATAAPSAGEVAKTVAALGEVDARARENLAAGLELMAADLLFTETTRTRQTLREQLRALRIAESKAVTDGRSTDMKQAWIVLAGVALLFAWALVSSSRGTTVAATASVSDPSSEAPARTLLPLQEPERAAPAPSIDLKETAALCTDISRIQADSDLQGLLARAAALLGAPGMVVWMAAGEEIFPVTAHGYDSRQLSRIGPINRSSMNATAAAWRSGAMQIVAGDATARSAIVAPLLGIDRCVGVLAIELPTGRAVDVTTQAVVTLIAAQLATVLGAWPAASSAQPADVLAFERVSASS
ncbi:MAG TPA: GAF domain-containing protein [Vicinamibacterales bacterium]|nr:GAF domain-containing protein [Vicinamibacterales bacterium]